MTASRAPARYDVTGPDLARLLGGEPGYRLDQVWHGLHQRGLDPGEMTDPPRALPARLGAAAPPALAPPPETEGGGGDTRKSPLCPNGSQTGAPIQDPP